MISQTSFSISMSEKHQKKAQDCLSRKFYHAFDILKNSLMKMMLKMNYCLIY